VSNGADERIKAHLNLYAILPNLEELVRLDTEMASLIRDKNVVVQFSVKGGPAAHVAFKDGACTHGRGQHDRPTIKLHCRSPKHLNAVFDGRAKPIPLKGFTKLGFMTREFAALTERMEAYLRPSEDQLDDAGFMKINTVLLLHTALFAVGELAVLEPESRDLAAHMGSGLMQVEVRPDGPHVALDVKDGAVTVTKRKVDRPRARMTFRDLAAVAAVLNNRVDSFQAIVQGDVALSGYMPLLNNAGLILDRVGYHLS